MRAAAYRRRHHRWWVRGQAANPRQHHAVQHEQALNAVDLARALAREGEELAVQVSTALLLDARHVQPAPDVALAGVMAQQQAYERGGVQAARLRPSGAPGLPDTGRVDDDVLDAAGRQRAVQPEAVSPRLVAAHDHRGRRQTKPILVGRDLLLELRELTGRQRPPTRGMLNGRGEGELSATLAEIEGEVQRGGGADGTRRASRQGRHRLPGRESRGSDYDGGRSGWSANAYIVSDGRARASGISPVGITVMHHCGYPDEPAAELWR